MRLTTCGAVVALIFSGIPAAAQVGHAPSSSPYSDIRANHGISVLYSRVGGNGGLVQVGPRSGETVGLRYDIRMGTPSEIYFGLWTGDFDRRLLDPAQAPANRVFADMTDRMTGIEVGLNWLVTGKKTWRGIAPYFGAAFGIVVGGTIATDPGGFGFNGKFFAAPQIGTRFYATSNLAIRIEARDFLWKLTYPSVYFLDPELAPGTDPILDGATLSDTEWTHQPTLTLGLSYAFRY